MKKCLTLVFALTLGLIWLAGPVASRPRTDSLRSQATAGFFKHEYDRLSDNPAYVGAKTTELDYQGSITKEKGQLFSTSDGLNTDGRFLLGGIGNPGLDAIGAIGGYIEVGMQTQSQDLNLNENFSNVGVNLTSLEGAGEGSDSFHDGTGEYYDYKETMYGEEENYWNDNHLNAKVAVGGIQAGELTFGVSFERNTDVLSNNGGYDSIDEKFNTQTGEFTDEGNFNFLEQRLPDGHTENTIAGSFDNETTFLANNYLFTLGVIMPIGGLLQSLEAELTINSIQYERTENNSGSLVDNDVGNEIETSSYFIDGDNLSSDETKSKALQYGITILTREEIMGWSAATYISYMAGGLSPNEDRTQIYSDFSTEVFPTLTTYENWSTTTGTKKYSGDGMSRNEIEAGILMRKQKESLLIGFGFSYSLNIWEDKYSLTNTYSKVVRFDDGDPVVDATDMTTYTTGSYTDNYTENGVTQTFAIPIGLEYQATPTLCWRVGATHVTELKTSETKWERAGASDLFVDEDRDDIAGNETDNDGILNSATDSVTAIGSYSFNTQSRGSREYNKDYNQYNLYSVGLGYTVEDPLQIDILWSIAANNYFAIDTTYLFMSVTYIF